MEKIYQEYHYHEGLKLLKRRRRSRAASLAVEAGEGMKILRYESTI